MAIYPERRSGKLTGCWIAEVTAHGERRRKRHESQSAAQRWCDFIKLTGAPPPEEKAEVTGHTFGSVADEAKEHHAGWQSDRDHSRGQRLDYVTAVLGKDTPIKDVRTTDLDRLVKTLKVRPGIKGKLSAGTINRYLAVASAVLTFAKKREYIIGVPSITWQEEEGKRIHWLDDAQEDALAGFMLACGQKDGETTLRVLTRTGLRWSEFEGLTPADVCGEWIKLDKTKTDSPRDVPIDRQLGERLTEMLTGKRAPAYYTFRKLLKAALKSAGQSEALSIHCLRHSTATRLTHAGVNLAIVKDFLGHSSINTTLKYTHVTKKTLADAAKILSPHAGQFASNAPQPIEEVPGREATPGIEPGSSDLQSDE
jgi:integrase